MNTVKTMDLTHICTQMQSYNHKNYEENSKQKKQNMSTEFMLLFMWYIKENVSFP